MIVAAGALLLLLGGFGIAYGFTRGDDDTKAGGTTTGPARPPAPSTCRR